MQRAEQEFLAKVLEPYKKKKKKKEKGSLAIIQGCYHAPRSRLNPIYGAP